jgi:non-ribosomal peptide synthase protein (TIGR01720 family)
VVDTTAELQAEQGLVTGSAPLTPVQHWFFAQHLPEPHHWNHAILLELRQSLDPALLEQAVRHLLAQHDALRLRFAPTATGWRQEHATGDQAPPFIRYDLTKKAAPGAAIEAHCAALQASLNLAEGPLVRVAFFDLGPQRAGRLLILIHHLVIDGVGWRILLEDLMTAYQQLSQGRNVQLPPKTTSFKDWAEKLAAYAQTAELREEAPYWLTPARARVAPLPVDAAGANTAGSANTVSVALTSEETRALLQEAAQAYRTQINDLLLAALVQTCTRWTGEQTLLIELESHGREALFDDADLSRTVGWFTAIFPVLLTAGQTEPGCRAGSQPALQPAEASRKAGWEPALQPAEASCRAGSQPALQLAPEPGRALKAVKEQLRAVPRGGVGYGLLRYLSADETIAAQFAALPQAEISFNYLGQFDQLLPADAPFGPAPEAVGPVHSPRGERRYLLEVNAFISGGRLQLEWTYSANLHQRETIARLAEDYLATLRALLAHCLAPEAGGHTPSDFPLAKLTQPQLDGLLGAEREIEDLYPLSPVQEGMLFYTLLAPASGAYVTQVLYELEGVNVAALKDAWRQVLEHHPILRTAFVWKNLAQPLQIVRQRVELPLLEEDWRALPADERQTRLTEFLQAEQQRGFELSAAPLLRVALFRLTEQTYQLVWSYHHLLLDGWSVPLLTSEFLNCYEALVNNQEAQWERRRPYRDYIAWLQEQKLADAEAFWRRFLKGFTSATPLLGSKQAGSLGLPERTDTEIRLTEAATAALAAFARQQQLTLNTLVQGAWALLLSYDSGQEDVLFGATLSGRPAGLPGAEAMIGLFINTLPMRVETPAAETLLPWLRRLQEQQAELRQYENSPLSEVHRWSEVPPDNPLFESIVVFENFPLGGAQSLQGQGLRFVNTEFLIRNNFPLTVRATPGAQLSLKALVDPSRFSTQAATRMLARLALLLPSMVAQPAATLAELKEQLAAADRQEQSGQAEEFKAARRQRLKDVRRKAVSGSQTENGD